MQVAAIGRTLSVGRAAWSRTRRAWRCFAVCTTALLASAGSGGTDVFGADVSRLLAGFQRQHRDLYIRFVETLDTLAADAKAAGDEALAGEIRRRGVRPDDDVIDNFELPTAVVGAAPLPADPVRRALLVRLRSAESDYAADLYLLSRRVLKAGLPSYAYRLVREVLFHDSDHAAARRIFGYLKVGDEWLTPFAARMRREGKVWNDAFGWLPAAYVERYQRGERYTPLGWMDAAREAAWRQDFKNAWQIETEHFRVRTNHSLEQGVKIAKALEEFHDHFYRVFAGFFLTPQQLQQLFAGGATGRSRFQYRPHEVHYFRSRDEYNERLRARIPLIEITNGLYLTGDRTSYFFFHTDANVPFETTLYHEATHQLFYESQPYERPIAADAHFWIVEGIACYMESFRPKAKGRVLGDPSYVRFRAARYRLERENYFLPLAELAALGMDAFQQHPKIRENYSEVSGYAHYFMHYGEGRYRDALITHLTQLYHRNPRRPVPVQSLAELTGVSYAAHDEQYKRYILTLGDPPAAVDGKFSTGDQ